MRPSQARITTSGAYLLLFLLFLQAGLSLPLASPSFDEPYDIARGYAYARGPDLRMQQEHPVLIDGLGGLMLRLMPELTPPEQIPGWEEAHLFQFSQSLLWKLDHDVDKMMFLARFPVMCIALVLGAVVYRWTSELIGSIGGLLALTLLVFNPNIVAHARILSTDLGAACLATASFFLWWRWARQPSLGRLAAVTVMLGLALAAKTSNLTVLALICGLTCFRTYQRHWRWARAVAACLTVGLGALLILWGLYRFELRPIPELFGLIPVPIASYWEAISWLQKQMALGRPAFLLGQHTLWGWWYYFPVVFLIKTPLPLIILLLFALFIDLSRRMKRRLDAGYVLWVYPVMYLGLSAFSTLNLGYRHILPIIPLLTIYAARVALWQGSSTRWARGILAGLLAWLVVSGGMIFPYHLAYFNELVGGPSNGYRCLVDSNLDWGQDLKTLKRYLEEQHIEDLWLGYFGTGSPDYYDISYRPIFTPGSPHFAPGFAPLNPAPGWYAISATVLQGPFASEPDAFDWFRRHEPTAMIGYSILVYQVDADPDPPGWLGLCYAPKPVLNEDQALQRLGRVDLRVVGFDCSQSWVMPSGEAPGWYLVPLSSDDPDTPGADFIRESEIVSRGRGLGDVPGYTLYRVDGSVAGNHLILTRKAWSSLALAPAERDALSALSMPVNLGGELEFLGYQISAADVKPGDEVEITTLWHVLSRPDDPALSLFAHLVGTAGAVSVGDGLSYSAIQWLPGDVFAQQSELVVPAATSPGRCWIQVGIYSLATSDRLQVLENGQAVTDRILLMPVEVR